MISNTSERARISQNQITVTGPTVGMTGPHHTRHGEGEPILLRVSAIVAASAVPQCQAEIRCQAEVRRPFFLAPGGRLMHKERAN